LIALAILLFNPVRIQRVSGGPPTVLLDASLSMGATGSHWKTALDTARSLAGLGTIFRFGDAVSRFDSTAPRAGPPRLGDALRVAAGRSAPVIVVTDGAINDAEVLPEGLLRAVKVVLVPRDSIADAALVDVALEPRSQRADTVSGTVL